MRPHNIRVIHFAGGGASFAFEMGMNFLEIKQRGDWASDAVEKYIHISQKHIKSVATQLIDGAVFKCRYI